MSLTARQLPPPRALSEMAEPIEEGAGRSVAELENISG
jgi:hypothetical protein